MRFAPHAIVLSIGLTIAIGVLGPSAVVPDVGGFSLGLRPSPYLVIGMAALAVVLGGLGLIGGILGNLTGRKLMLLGCVAAGILAFLPPSGSGDHLNYAVYGRMVTLGIDPYTHGAVDLPGDPIADAVEKPWREEPSVYGPVATGVQALASWIGGDSLRVTILVLALVNAAAFIATGLLLQRLTPRAALLWTANPLLLYHLVAGMHVDTLAIALVTAALALRAKPLLAGALFGLGVGVKVNAGLVALGPAWELRRNLGRLAVMAGSAVAVVAVGYALVGVRALAPLSTTSKAVSWASYWKLVQGWLQGLFGSGAYRTALQVGAVLVIVALAWLMFRAVGRQADAPVVAAVLMTAYVFATPYILPWYDGFAFAVVALMAASRVDVFLAAHLTVLSLGYLPARQEMQPENLGWLVTVVRAQVVPWALLALTLGLGWWAWRAAARARTLPEPAAPRP
ncbi:glycosyltransferase 87 family protein [Nonomuraea sp. NPDC050556]|uniref:glycosyltransferase 87 family protein n=1 Tax=Nonomuraea sp. NPDC050556 TaxID=3364369 RepID=UPI0037AD60E0